MEEWDRTWSTLEDYRGINANMHTVEAYLAVGDVTGDPAWHRRAGLIAARVAGWAERNGWRVPEHFDATWAPLLEHHRDEPAHPFRPYGATVGHGLEWARLLVAVDATVGAEAPARLVVAAEALADRAVADGWAADGADGSSTPPTGRGVRWFTAGCTGCWPRPSTPPRCCAGPPARRATPSRCERWWAYAERHLIDHERGSWHHELDEGNRPSAEVWSGKPDVYHAYQAALLPIVPVAPSFAAALAGLPGPGARQGTEQGAGRTLPPAR